MTPTLLETITYKELRRDFENFPKMGISKALLLIIHNFPIYSIMRKNEFHLILGGLREIRPVLNNLLAGNPFRRRKSRSGKLPEASLTRITHLRTSDWINLTPVFKLTECAFRRNALPELPFEEVVGFFAFRGRKSARGLSTKSPFRMKNSRFVRERCCSSSLSHPRKWQIKFPTVYGCITLRLLFFFFN